ncbi:putative fructosamine-3-kinase [Aspergillus candidus]|uniref:protein-ribulosamine 3-kinase n=1 Tax=Aspergillus candidus TaxID=41067 RepID=A0A2I2FEV1_ASPCN|nr:aminoglycoside phosphotransferase [Aspergillus candidus]PLB39158.1 aminoglycoside phosphotransferase [Aspergillus candidus]
MSPLPPPILQSLSLPPNTKATLSTANLGSGFTSTGTIRALIPSPSNPDQEEERRYFVKTSSTGAAAQEMFRGEYESLNAIANAVPGFCPRGIAWGALDEGGKTFFLVTEFLELGGRVGRGKAKGEKSLAQRLGKLHSTPASPDPSTGRRRFGFPVPTFCGDTRQGNTFHDSWAEFYAEERLMSVLRVSEERNGRGDRELRGMVERTAQEVVPALLGDGHLGGEAGVEPVVVHGDLWSGNADWGVIVGGSGDDGGGGGDVVYDPSACYAHSEFELGIMRMFGGFGSGFFEEYHRVVPRTEPVGEYDDRVSLYELYHHLNHHAIFGAGYRSGAMAIMQKLIKKYGSG